MRKAFVKNIKSMVIKVGTSVLTSEGRFDRKVINDLASEISVFLKKGIKVSLVSSGAIGAGMTNLGLKKRPKAMQELQAAAAAGQRYLMQCYEEAFTRHGFSTAQILLTWDDLAQRGRFLNAKHTLEQIQKWGLVPVVNENDTVATDEIRFGDNDKLSALLSVLAQSDVLVVLSNTDGLYSNGRQGEKASRIQIVERMEDSIFSHVRDKGTDFTVGGMRSKLEAVRMSVSSGIPVFLANGRSKKILTRIFAGEDVGTLFVPHLSKGRARQNWLKYFLNNLEAGRPLARAGR